jgi:hypothetical protein
MLLAQCKLFYVKEFLFSFLITTCNNNCWNAISLYKQLLPYKSTQQ